MTASRRHQGVLYVAVLLCAFWGYARIFRKPLLAGIGFSSQVFDEHHKLLRLTLAEDQTFRLQKPLNDIDPNLVSAFLLHEDQYFYLHAGVNIFSLLRAVGETYIKHGTTQGASTITMQVARLRYGLHTRSPSGKLRQILQALWMESLYSKDEILHAYLSLIPFGGNIEGIETATQIYFHQSAKRLSLPQILRLALIPQNPNKRTFDSQNTSASLEALKKIWFKAHPDEASTEVDFSLPLNTYSVKDLPFEAPHFVQSILDTPSKNSERLTTLNLQAQHTLEKILHQFLQNYRSQSINNAAAVLVDSQSGDIKAYIGSADFFDSKISGQVDGVSARRSPGSTLKPILYALAIDQGLIHSETLLKDAPMSFAHFDPENFDREFKGPISATEALVYSRNLPAVYLASRLKNPTLYEMLQNAGISFPESEAHYGLALPLGGAELSLLELARLYRGLARGGIFATPEAKLLSPESAFMVSNMLRHNPRPYQRWTAGQRQSVATRDDMDIAWKTGTSFGFRDAWTLGNFQNLTLGVWIGNFDNSSNPLLVGRELAAPLFFAMIDAIKEMKISKVPLLTQTPVQIREIEVCALSGAIASAHCPHRKMAWFIPSVSPINVCSVHREILLSRASGLRTCNPTQAGIKREVVEFWPSDILKIFAAAGLPRRPAPPFEEKCKISPMADLGQAPVISSPKPDLEYKLHATGEIQQEIPLQAVTDGDARKIYWFANDAFLGTSLAGKQALAWPAKVGRFKIRAVDEMGRSDERDVRVSLIE